MFLSRRDILKEINKKRLRFDPPIDPGRVEQISVDLLLGHRFACFKRAEDLNYLEAVRLDPSIWQALDIWEEFDGDYLLKPGGFVLAQTLETVCIPNNLAGMVEGRSSFARLGITTHLTAPKIDPGFEGTITLEIANLGGLPIKLRAGVEKIAQLILVRLSRPLTKNELYGAAPAHVFQHQRGPIPAKRKPEKAIARRKR